MSRISMQSSWFSAQRAKISELKTVRQLDFANDSWKLTSSSLLVIQLCKNLSSNQIYALFVDNFFISVKLFKALKIMNIEACETTKVESGFLTQLIRLRAAATKEKHWGKMSLMIVESNKKMNIEKENVLCMIWVDLNIVQYMITMHIIEEMRDITWKNLERRHEISKSVKSTEKLSFSTSIVEYNTYMSESDENAQQRSYYSSHRSDSRYWWSIFIFFLKTTVLNAYKLWDLLYSHSKLTHLKFQRQIIEHLLASSDQTRQMSSVISLTFTNKKDSSTSCRWKHMKKLSYCVFCKVQLAESRKRKALSKISSNLIKRRRESQTIWRCSNCDSCCKKKNCWDVLHS